MLKLTSMIAQRIIFVVLIKRKVREFENKPRAYFLEGGGAYFHFQDYFCVVIYETHFQPKGGGLISRGLDTVILQGVTVIYNPVEKATVICLQNEYMRVLKAKITVKLIKEEE